MNVENPCCIVVACPLHVSGDCDTRQACGGVGRLSITVGGGGGVGCGGGAVEYEYEYDKEAQSVKSEQ